MARKDEQPGKAAAPDGSCGCGEYREDAVCPDDAPWNKQEGGSR